MNVLEFIKNENLINDQTLSKAQETIIKSIYGLELTSEELEIFKELTGWSTYPMGKEWSEVTAILPRRSGKTSQVCANLTIWESCGREHQISAGSIPTVMIIASEKRRQARICFNYVLRKLESSKILSRMIKNVTREEIQLTNGVSIMVFPCDQARVRGHSLLMLCADEVAAWRSEGVNPDSDIIDAARPGLEYENSKLIKISTPGGMFGEIWNDYKQFHSKENEDILVFGSGGHNTRYFNPSYSQLKLERLKHRKPFVYEHEHLAEFKKSQGIFDPLIIDGLVNHNRELELPPQEGTDYFAFTDTAGGSGKDSYSICIGHAVEGRVIIDLVRSKQPPFDPEAQTKAYCKLLHRYRINRVQGDRYSGDWCARSFQKHGVFYEKCEKSKSEIYLECESPFNCGIVELPPLDSLSHQLKLLVRTPRSGTKDRVDTVGGQPEDEANTCCGVVWMIYNELYEKPLVPSLGVVEEIETEKQKLDREARAWLLDKPLRKKRKTKDGVDYTEIEDQIKEWESEFEVEQTKKDTAKDVLFSRKW